MGAKARAAIANAERAAASMTQYVADMKNHLDEMYTQQGVSIDAQIALAKYVGDTYPNESNLPARSRQDPKLRELAAAVVTAKKKVQKEKDACRKGLDGFEEEGDKIVDALNQLTALINAKITKRNEVVRSNVFKKLIVKSKTKSLGDLQDEKRKVLAVVNEIGPIVDQIRADPNFRNG
jgi:hypothetical protein